MKKFFLFAVLATFFCVFEISASDASYVVNLELIKNARVREQHTTIWQQMCVIGDSRQDPNGFFRYRPEFRTPGTNIASIIDLIKGIISALLETKRTHVFKVENIRLHLGHLNPYEERKLRELINGAIKELIVIETIRENFCLSPFSNPPLKTTLEESLSDKRKQMRDQIYTMLVWRQD